jgi:carbonic anhydrase
MEDDMDAGKTIQQEFDTSALIEIRAVYGVYLLETREVWASRVNDVGIGLAAVPHDIAGFVDLGNAVAQSERIASYFK